MRALRWVLGGALVVLVVVTVAALNVLRSIVLTDRVTLVTPRLPSLGANILVYRNTDTTIVVDSQLAPLSTLVRLRVGSLNDSDNIIITHWHPDHSGGFAALRSKATVWAHESTRKRLASDQIGHDLTAPGSIHQFKARPEGALPEHFVDTRVALGAAEVVHFPAGHTTGDLAVFFAAENVVAVGDLVWPGSFPFVDFHTGGSVSGLLAALDAIILRSAPDTIIVPGHGNVLSLTELVAYRDMVAATAQAIVCAADPVAALVDWQMWSSTLVPTERWIEMLAADPQLQCTQ